jgi:hypothetical protein
MRAPYAAPMTGVTGNVTTAVPYGANAVRARDPDIHSPVEAALRSRKPALESTTYMGTASTGEVRGFRCSESTHLARACERINEVGSYRASANMAEVSQTVAESVITTER